MVSKKATKIDEIFTVDLTVTIYCQIAGEDFVIFCGLLRKREHYIILIIRINMAGYIYKVLDLESLRGTNFI